MQGWSLPLGRVFGVEVRLHSLFVFLLLPAMVWAGSLGGTPLRGAVLWLLVLLAVLVREAGRALVGAWFGLAAQRIVLLPTGALAEYRPAKLDGRLNELGAERAMALAGPLVSFAFGLTLAGLALAISPAVSLRALRLISPDHLLRAAVWTNLLLGAVNLLPAGSLDGGRLLRAELLRAGGHEAPLLRAMALVGPGMPWGLIALGVVLGNWWAVAMGLAVVAAGQAERQGVNPAGVGGDLGRAGLQPGKAAGAGAVADMVRVRDVMLTEYSVLAAGATLEDAVAQARQTLQDVFPVVRGNQMVGAAGRAEILHALNVNGNGYVQGMMAKTFQTASPEDGVMETLNRVMAAIGGGSHLVPVVEGERVVGVVTPENLQRAMSLLRRTRRGAGSGER